MDIEKLVSEVIDAAFTVRESLSAGYLESVYQNALIYELSLRQIKAEAETAIAVHYKDIVVGEFRADIFVEDCLIIELKAIRELSAINEAQLVNYLNATHIETGLLINYGGPRIEIKRKYRSYKAQ